MASGTPRRAIWARLHEQVSSPRSTPGSGVAVVRWYRGSRSAARRSRGRLRAAVAASVLAMVVTVGIWRVGGTGPMLAFLVLWSVGYVAVFGALDVRDHQRAGDVRSSR